jgi:hypothetical protein
MDYKGSWLVNSLDLANGRREVYTSSNIHEPFSLQWMDGFDKFRPFDCE